MILEVAVIAGSCYVIGEDLTSRWIHRKDAEILDVLSQLDCGGIMSPKELTQFKKDSWGAIRHIERRNGNASVYQEHFIRCFHKKI